MLKKLLFIVDVLKRLAEFKNSAANGEVYHDDDE
jgi:hypothetical protein